MKLIFAVAICIFAFNASVGAQQSSSEKKAESKNSPAICPMHDAHSQMNERGEKGYNAPFLIKNQWRCHPS
jgi:hypothetical protein